MVAEGLKENLECPTQLTTVHTNITSAAAILGPMLRISTKIGSRARLMQKVKTYVVKNLRNSAMTARPLTSDLKVTYLWKIYAFVMASRLLRTIAVI